MDNMRHLIRLLISFLLFVPVFSQETTEKGRLSDITTKRISHKILVTLSASGNNGFLPYRQVIANNGVIGLSDLKITVPRMVRSGDSVWLTCTYDLKGKMLYTVKWYLDEAEFYRYAPKKEPPGLVLPVRNINVNLTISNKNEVVLLNVSKKQSGMYKCEATEELPTLETKTDEAPMTIVDVPENDPTILVERQRLPVGETLRANCTSGASFPAPTISWALNGEPIENVTMFFKEDTKNIRIDEERISTRSELEVSMSSEVFQNGRLLLRCFASIPVIYRATAEIEITEDVPFIASITGDASPRSHRTSGCRLSQSLGLVGMTIAFILATTSASV